MAAGMDMIHVYDTVTGRRLESLPATSWSWQRRLSGSGSLSVTIPWSRALAGRDLRAELVPWRTTLAVVDSSTRRVVAAGIIWARKWSADTATLEVSCEDVWGLLKRRLVMPPDSETFPGGVVDMTDPSQALEWEVSMSGSLADIAVDLVNLSMALSSIPIVLPERTGGQNTRTWLGPDMDTVEARLSDLTQVQGGPEIRFDPELVEGTTSLRWRMVVGSPEIVTSHHRWDARRRAVPLVDLQVEEDASAMSTECWARGGSQDDQTLIAHYHDPVLESEGWPRLQAADTSHSTVSELSTLTAHVMVGPLMRDQSVEVVTLKARRADTAGWPLGDAVFPGDHIRLRHEDAYLGSGILQLKVLEVSGSEDEWVTCSCREVIKEEP